MTIPGVCPLLEEILVSKPLQEIVRAHPQLEVAEKTAPFVFDEEGNPRAA